MVARMMRWRPWPPVARKFRVRLVVRRAEGVATGAGAVLAEVRWKGPRAALGALRRTMRNRTRAAAGGGEGDGEAKGVVEWNEEFEIVASLAAQKEGAFHPWEIAFTVLNGINQGPKSKESVIGIASLNLAEFAASSEEEIKIDLPLFLPGAASEASPSLHLTLSMVELRTSQETSDMMPRCLMPFPLSPTAGDALSSEKDELSALKAGLRKVKIITDFVSTRKSKKCRDDEGSEERCSARSEDADYAYPFDTDSLDDDLDEGEVEDGKGDNSFRKSFSYGTLPSANFLGGAFCSDTRVNGDYEDWVYYSHRRSDVGYLHAEETSGSFPEQSVLQTSKRSILPWKKRKLSFKSPKAKGEPLLKKAYGEEGGDDIDFDRRQLSSSDESLSIGRHKVDYESTANCSSVSDFGDDNFAVGCWEAKDIVSRDGHMKLCTQVFFASIDQRNERAAGESACTALVAVIANWFQKNPGMMPIKSQFDGLIREGSLEWRNLCENQTYRERFPDKHFDLDTVIQAEIRPLLVHSGKSFIGFFHPEGTEDISGFEFLHGAMSFDSIWEEISRVGADCSADGNPQLYIVSWNDHFFVLKVEEEAYYIIDTLGERLYEGCDQAYILKFDESTVIHRVLGEDKSATTEAASAGNQQTQHSNTKEGSSSGEHDGSDAADDSDGEEHIVCRGKESCKEYIKSFLAAIPIRELQADIKKGLMASTPLHHRLQIEFHYTESSPEGMLARVPPSAGAIAEFSDPDEPVGAAAFSPTPVNLELEVA